MPRHRRSDNAEGAVALLGCSFYIACFAASLTIGGLLFQYALSSIFGKDVPWYADALGGAITNAFVVPVAILCWIARLAGVEAPFIH